MEIILVGIIGGNYIWKIQNGSSQSKISMMPVKREYIQYPSIEDLQYYYEFKPSTNQITEIGEVPWLHRRVVATINKDGLNERFDYSVEKPPNIYRIITIGDSFTFGAFMNTSENYPETLEELLNNRLRCKNITKFEVINLGVWGYDINFSIYRYRLRGKKYQPNLVLWYLKEDDFTIPDSYFDTDAGHSQSEAAIDFETKKLMNFTKDYDMSVLAFTDQQTPLKFKKILKLFSKTRNNSYFFDGIEQFARLPDGHPTAESYTYIAKTLFNYLTANNLISCQR